MNSSRNLESEEDKTSLERKFPSYAKTFLRQNFLTQKT